MEFLSNEPRLWGNNSKGYFKDSYCIGTKIQENSGSFVIMSINLETTYRFYRCKTEPKSL